MYPIPKVHLNHEFLKYIMITKECLWNIRSKTKDTPLASNRIQSIHEISIVFQKRNHDQIWKHASYTYTIAKLVDQHGPQHDPKT